MLASGDPFPSFSICVQCGRCASGCPVAFEAPHTPRKVIRFLQLGELQSACQSPFLWFCALCQACTVRCPRGVDISGLMLALRREGLRRGWIKLEKDLYFYKAFKEMVGKGGKISELRLGWETALHKFPRHPVEEAILLFKLWRKGKMKIG